MIRRILPLVAVALLSAGASVRAATFVYVSVAAEKRIAVYRLDAQTGKLAHRSDCKVEDGEPGALTIDPQKRFLLAAIRSTGKLASFRIDSATGRLTHQSTVPAGPDPAQISTDRDGRYLLTAYYVAAKVTVHAIGKDGRLSEKPLQSIATADKAHAAVPDPSGRFVFVPHTGPDLIFQFVFDPGSGRLSANEPARLQTPKGTGPRHLVFHPSRPAAYVSNEQGGSVTAYALDEKAGTLRPLQTVSTLPEGFRGDNACAEVKVHPSGRFVYVSNRGHDSIAAFSVKNDGKLSALGQTDTEKTPRSFDIDPSGKYLLAAGEAAGKLAVYRIDAETGKLARRTTCEVGKMPWWVLAVDLPARVETPESLRKKAAAVLAQLEGEIKVPGLKEPVEVLRDRWGVPHIYAHSADDLFFAQGFVVAQDRLFQMDLWRRIGLGETSELVGESGLQADRFARLLRYRGDMDAEWASYAPDARRIATAFTRGINAYIDHVGDRLPVEFQILGARPKKWRPEDCLGRMSGIVMSRSFRTEPGRAELVAAVGVEKARRVAPTDPPVAYAPAPGLDLAGIDRSLLAGYDAAVKVPAFTLGSDGSNNWAVDGTLSASGKPMLASDPHRAIALPSLRYLVHLHSPGWNVIGSGEPGLPGVAIGHNERVAWGFTIVGTDQTDFYVEETNPADATQYRVGSRWEKMTILREKVAVRGQGRPTELELRFTRHGPVIAEDGKRHRAVALRWAGSEPGGAAYLASLSLDQARDGHDFVAALKRWKVPSENMVYADVEGNIGWVAAALTPVRKGHHGLLPVPGAGGYEWQRFLPLEELPQDHNPAAHYVATANHNILPAGYKAEIGYEWASPYRFARIKERLEGQKKLTREDFQSIQHDVTTLPGRVLARLVKAVDTQDRELRPYVELLAGWDGVLSDSSRAGAHYGVWLQELTDGFYRPHVPPALVEFTSARGGMPVILAALEKPDTAWFGDRPVEGRDRLLRTSLQRAVDRLRKLLPGDEKDWSWGRLHTTTFRHPLAALGPAYAEAFNLGPVPRGGDAYTPNAATHNVRFEHTSGATYRHVLDLADWDRGLSTSAPGQSGQPGSPHYGDLLPLWQKGEYFPLAFSRARVEEVTRHRLRLIPAQR
jgi:penicillin amidase